MTQYAIANGATKWIQVWLLVLGVLVYAMILVGGATRLTDSGLSITEWAPLSGAVPPLSAAAWDAEFAAYRETAEYRLQNVGMSMSEFQWIYWWEWGHRQLGRLIGLVAIVGFVWFVLAKWIDRPLARRMLLLIGLGGLQGFIGWWMVSSGIGDTTRVDVAPYRLMTHFCLALLIIATIAWTWLDIASDRNLANTAVSAAERRAAICLLVLVGFQMAAGALVAGHDAGRTYTDWPLMAGETVPSGYWRADLGLRNVVENVANVQFNHRLLAYILFGSALGALFAFRRAALRADFAVLSTLVVLQSAWGVLTLMNAAPLNLALAHQGFGVLIVLAAVKLAWRATSRTPKAQVA